MRGFLLAIPFPQGAVIKGKRSLIVGNRSGPDGYARAAQGTKIEGLPDPGFPQQVRSEQLLRGQAGGDPASVHEYDPIHGPVQNIFQAVFHNDDGLARFPVQRVDQFHRVFPRGGIKVCQRLVKKQHIRLVHQNPGHGNSLFLAAGKVLRRFTKVFRHVHERSRLSDPLPHEFRRDAVVLQRKSDVLGGGKPHELAVGILQNRTCLLGNIEDVETANILPEKRQSARKFTLESMGDDPVNTMEQR